MEKHGFVYVWFDKWREMFYVGCHWGTEDDGYICSSNRMRDAYRRRPQDFKRRIVARITTSRQDLLTEEYRWLDMIKDDDLGTRYYNIKKWHAGHWSADEELRKTVKCGPRGGKHSDEAKAKMSAALKGRVGPNLGKKLKPHSTESKEQRRHWMLANAPMRGKQHSDEARRKMSEAKKGKPSPKRGTKLSEETCRKISEGKKGRPHIKKRAPGYNVGRKLSEETRRKMSEAAKIREANKRLAV